MRTKLLLIIALYILNLPVFGAKLKVDKEKTNKSLYDTLVIKSISNELYICTCKPNTCNPNGEGKVYYQGKYKEEKVTNDADYHNCDERFLIQWDLSKLPKGIKIIEAKMELYCRSFSGDKQGQLVYECINETWNTDIGYSKKPNTLIETRILNDWPESKQYYTINITDFIRSWHHNKIPNYGLMGYSINTETTNSAVFCSSIFPNENLRPKLIIIFSKK